MTGNRRHFSRVRFHTEAKLSFPGGDSIPVELADLSLKGALVRSESNAFIPIGSNGELQISLGDDNLIRMVVTVVHHERGCHGLACREIDLDSITHLRRLVALNLGDEIAAERELAQLTQPD